MKQTLSHDRRPRQNVARTMAFFGACSVRYPRSPLAGEKALDGAEVGWRQSTGVFAVSVLRRRVQLITESQLEPVGRKNQKSGEDSKMRFMTLGRDRSVWPGPAL